MNDQINSKHTPSKPQAEELQNKYRQNRKLSLPLEVMRTRHNGELLVSRRTFEAIEYELPEISRMNMPDYSQSPVEAVARPAAQLVLQQAMPAQPEAVNEPAVMAYPQAVVEAAAQMRPVAEQAPAYDKSASVFDAKQRVLNSYTNGDQTTYHEFLKDHPREQYSAAAPAADPFVALGYTEIGPMDQKEFELAA